MAYYLGMALSEEEKQRIREEEFVRFQARQDFKRIPTPTTKAELAVAIGVPLAVLGAFLLKAALSAAPVN